MGFQISLCLQICFYFQNLFHFQVHLDVQVQLGNRVCVGIQYYLNSGFVQVLTTVFDSGNIFMATLFWVSESISISKFGRVFRVTGILRFCRVSEFVKMTGCDRLCMNI